MTRPEGRQVEALSRPGLRLVTLWGAWLTWNWSQYTRMEQITALRGPGEEARARY